MPEPSQALLQAAIIQSNRTAFHKCGYAKDVAAPALQAGQPYFHFNNNLSASAAFIGKALCFAAADGIAATLGQFSLSSLGKALAGMKMLPYGLSALLLIAVLILLFRLRRKSREAAGLRAQLGEMAAGAGGKHGNGDALEKLADKPGGKPGNGDAPGENIETPSLTGVSGKTEEAAAGPGLGGQAPGRQAARDAVPGPARQPENDETETTTLSHVPDSAGTVAAGLGPGGRTNGRLAAR